MRQLGSGRSVVYEIRHDHPLAGALAILFSAMRAQWAAIMDALREALRAEPSVMAGWYCGSVARSTDAPGSDLDVAVVVDGDVDAVSSRIRGALRDKEDALLIFLSLVGLAPEDVARLSAGEGDPWWRDVVRDARPLVGDRPEVLASRIRRVA